MLARIATAISGIILIVYGVIAAVSPLPLGVPLVVVGLLMVAAAVPATRPIIRAMRARWRWFDQLVRLAARRSPKRFHEVDEATTPPESSNSEERPK